METAVGATTRVIAFSGPNVGAEIIDSSVFTMSAVLSVVVSLYKLTFAGMLSKPEAVAIETGMRRMASLVLVPVQSCGYSIDMPLS